MSQEMIVGLDVLLSLALGIGLSAACGFRVFVPFLVMSVAALTGHLELGEGWEWIGSYPAVFAFATATVLEIAAYYVPWLDNTLDAVATPAAVVAGAVATAAVMTEMSPFLTWTLAAIAGGGAAGLVQTGTVLLRTLSTSTTLGLGNFTVATGELGGSLVTAILAIMLPWVTLALVLLLVVWVMRKLRRNRNRAMAV
ncbi:MAG TPA: DUF4126 domain-containing protein [Caldilineaceae bacterium]|nr:DUF4126 domain-containing protein [Caldilineaceae bacterium]